MGAQPLYEAIVRRARETGCAGATVLKGIEGFGAHSRIHRPHMLRLSEDLPVVIEIVDRADRILALLPMLDKMITEGLVTMERLEILSHSEEEHGT